MLGKATAAALKYMKYKNMGLKEKKRYKRTLLSKVAKILRLSRDIRQISMLLYPHCKIVLCEDIRRKLFSEDDNEFDLTKYNRLEEEYKRKPEWMRYSD